MSEMLTFGEITTGAQDDLDKITKMAYAQVCSAHDRFCCGTDVEICKRSSVILNLPILNDNNNATTTRLPTTE